MTTARTSLLMGVLLLLSATFLAWALHTHPVRCVGPSTACTHVLPHHPIVRSQQ